MHLVVVARNDLSLSSSGVAKQINWFLIGKLDIDVDISRTTPLEPFLTLKATRSD